MSFDKSFEHSDALYHAAIAEFAAKGYDAASINAILDGAGMSKGQFYHHFGSKQGLYFALIEALIARKRAFMAGLAHEALLDGGIFTLLRAQLEQGLAFTRAHPEIDAFAQGFLREKGSPIYAAALKRYNFANDAGLDALVARAYERGEFRDGLPLAFIQKTIAALLSHVAELTDLPTITSLRERFNLLVNFIQHGLARQPDETRD
jgi:AcrR family transcriptional regulator